MTQKRQFDGLERHVKNGNRVTEKAGNTGIITIIRAVSDRQKRGN